MSLFAKDIDSNLSSRVKKIKYSASEFALSKHWVQELNCPNPPFLNCRPPNNYDIPITLYNEVFGKFLRDCKDLSITNEDKNIVCELLLTMSGTFMSHNERIEAFQEWARKFIDYDTTSYNFSNNQSIDGVWRKEYNGKTILLTIFEFKNEFSSADPYMQASKYYSGYFEELHKEKSYILQQTCVPTFLVYIYGPYFGIAGAVVGQNITIDPLVEGSLIFRHGNKFWIDQITRVFCALRKANNHLDEYCGQIPKFQVSKEVTRQARFPFLKKYKSASEELMNIEYINRIDSESRKLVFLVKGSEGIMHILKFATSYNAEVHNFCFNKGFAPKLIKVDNIENTDYRFIIMEYLDGFNIISDVWHELNEKEKTELKVEILNVVNIMHDNNFVHGDLRFNNIMAKLDLNGKWVVKFIDFDWAGYDGEAEYPQFLNKEINWHSDAQQLGKIFRDHDNYLINHYFNDSC